MADPLANLKGRWVKGGPSPNPGGRPKAQQETRRRIADAIENRLKNEDELVQWAFRVMRGQEDGMTSEPSRVYAHGFLSDHYYGKPKQHVEIEDVTEPATGASLRAAVEALDQHEREALEIVLAGLRRAKAQGRIVDAESSQGDAAPTLDK